MLMADQTQAAATSEASAAAPVGSPKSGTDKSARGSRAVRYGVVTSDTRNKTISVQVDYAVSHPKYGKIVRRSTKLHAHDENNEARVGDKVFITECRPISKQKCWRLLRIHEKAPTAS
jgi:small subunit ribosomal protein S17